MSFDYSFLKDGIGSLADGFDPDACTALFDRLRADRDFSSQLFLCEKAFRESSDRRRVNPIPGERNLIERYDVAFIEENPRFVSEMRRILGTGYTIERRKFVVGVPERFIPAWLLGEIADLASGNLNPYVKPEFRDVTYMHGIDFHQDMIDSRGREPDFITCYVYLSPVGSDDSPVHVVPGSHAFGATVFPHDIRRIGGHSDLFRYHAGEGLSAELRARALTGGAGAAYYWHSCTLHGTRPHKTHIPRISIRYLLKKDPQDPDTLLDRVNRELLGSRSLAQTRVDVDRDGQILKRGNVLNAVPSRLIR